MVYNSDSGGDGGDVPTNIYDKLRAPICAQATCGRVCVSAVSDEDPKPDEHPKLDGDPKPDEDPKLDEAPTPSLHELGEAIAGTGRLRMRWGFVWKQVTHAHGRLHI